VISCGAARLGRCSIGMDAVRRRPIIKVFGAAFVRR
jgi:hypothetical protein